MRHAARFAVLLTVVSPVVAPWPLAVAQPSPPSASLEQKLRTQYPAGTVLVVQKQGIVGASACAVIPVAEYKDGLLHRPGKMQEIALKGALCAARDFPVGWRVNLGSLLVNSKSGKVSLRLVECDTCNSPATSLSFRAGVEFQFPKGSLDTTDPATIQDAINHVFAVDTSPPAPAPPPVATAPAPQPAPAPAAAPSTPPALGTVYVSAQNAANRLLLNADSSFLLQEDGQSYNGTYSVDGSALKVHIAQLNKDTDMTIDGAQLIVNGTETWVQPGQQPAPPDQQPPSGPPTIRKGDTIDEVKAKLGPPESVMDLGSKVMYLYKNVKITFIDGKVSGIE
jgi:hypothetical protein